MTTFRAVDMSEYTREIPVSAFRCLREQHQVEAVVLQAWGGGYTGGRKNVHFHAACANARAAGITKLAAYVWPPSEIRDALAFMGAEAQQMAFVALDVEANARLAQRHVQAVRDAGLTPVLYTNFPGRDYIDADVDRSLPLWLARYPLDLPPSAPIVWRAELGDAWGRLPPWWRGPVWGWQFRGTTDICGEQADLNLFDSAAFGAEEDDMGLTPDEAKFIDARFDNIEAYARATDALARTTKAAHESTRLFALELARQFDEHRRNVQLHDGETADAADLARRIARLETEIAENAGRDQELEARLDAAAAALGGGE
jgi:hypothetical protein